MVTRWAAKKVASSVLGFDPSDSLELLSPRTLIGRLVLGIAKMYDRKNPATKGRVARILGRLTLRTGAFFAILVCLQALSLYLNIFGTVPVIPAAFYACINLVLTLICLVFVTIVLGARFLGLRTTKQFWVGFFASVFGGYLGLWMTFAVLSGNPLPGLS